VPAQSMLPARKRNVMLAIALAAVAAGATVAGLRVSHDGGDGHQRRASAHTRAHGGAPSRPRVLALAASDLGLPRARVRSELRSGRTLAQLADATPGRSAGGLLDALIAAREQQLSAGAAAATSPATRPARLARLRARLSADVYGSPRPSPQPSAARRAPS
jgi:hypothetical protein